MFTYVYFIFRNEIINKSGFNMERNLFLLFFMHDARFYALYTFVIYLYVFFFLFFCVANLENKSSEV